MSLQNYLIKLKFLYSCAIYDNYFDMVNQINNKGSNGRKDCKKVLFIQALLFIATFFNITIILFTHKVSDIVNFCICNWFYFEGISSLHFIWILINIYFAIYLNYIMFFRNGGHTFKVLYGIVKHSKGDFFIHQEKSFLHYTIDLIKFVNNIFLPVGKAYVTGLNILASK